MALQYSNFFFVNFIMEQMTNVTLTWLLIHFYNLLSPTSAVCPEKAFAKFPTTQQTLLNFYLSKATSSILIRDSQ